MVGIDSMGIYKTEETGIEKHHKKIKYYYWCYYYYINFVKIRKYFIFFAVKFR